MLAARTRARRRLIGAVVLLAVGIVGFPMLFETQPRPLAPDTPIVVAGRDAAPAAPAPVPGKPTAAQGVVVAELPPQPVETELPAQPVAPAAPPAASAPSGSSEPVPAATAAVPDARPASAPRVAERAESTRAQALLDGKGASAPEGAIRFVVQVGAYSDATKLRDVRARVEKLGLKTYTQVIETDAGRRTRVRVGPYATRAEADGISARLKGAGLPVAILAL